MAIDSNEIMVRSGDNPQTLSLQRDGGEFSIGGSTRVSFCEFGVTSNIRIKNNANQVLLIYYNQLVTQANNFTIKLSVHHPTDCWKSFHMKVEVVTEAGKAR